MTGSRTGALWLLRYGIATGDLEAYLAWFHEVHIPDKLARPGYDRAAHYRVVSPGSGPDVERFLALFGAPDTRVFLDPSPAQLKPRQDPLTRRMMPLRQASSMAVYGVEWSTPNAADAADSLPVLCLEGFDAQGEDEALAAWCAQERLPAMTACPGARGGHKLLATFGAPRHALLYAFDDADGARAAAGDAPSPVGTARAGAFEIAERVWPAPG